jgi:hypothetical protein
MTSHYPLVRIFRDNLLAFLAPLPALLAVLFVIVIVASPWVLLAIGGWHLFLRLYLIPYPFVLVAFGLIMAVINRRELLVRFRDWRASRKPAELKKAA